MVTRRVPMVTRTASADIVPLYNSGAANRSDTMTQPPREGGADNDELYTFAWLHYLTFGAGYRF